MRCRGFLIVAALVGAACSSGGDRATTASTAPSASTTTSMPRGDCQDLSRALDVAYGDDPLQKVDVYPPADADGCSPVVVWVHGGGWRKGDKHANVDDKVRLFNDAGWTFVSVNYRLTNIETANPVRYPSHNEDVAAAIAFLVENAMDYGIDSERIALLGHSAGAGIVAAVGADPAYLGAHALGLDALDCVGPLDTEGFDVARVASGTDAKGQLYRAVFGADPAGWVQASPLTHVLAGAGIAPMLVVRRGDAERQDQLQGFVDALRDAAVEVTAIDATTLSHEEVNRNIGADGDTVMTEPLMAFLTDCLD